MAEAGEDEIAVSNRCCWCCDWLSQHLETRFTLPGTHGVMYPWDPPKVGVSELVLKKLERELWNQLYEAVLKSVRSSFQAIWRPEFYILPDESLTLVSSATGLPFLVEEVE